MSVTPTLNLFVNYDDPQPYYWVDVILPEAGTYEAVSHGTVPTSANAADEVHIDVNIDTPNNGNETIQVLLGTISIDPDDGEVHINLLDASQTSKGSGIIKTEAAQEATRPIP